MSQGTACKCDERRKPVDKRNWVVKDRNCNFSAFSGYHHTWSQYSAVTCLKCRALWRTKADYVLLLPDETL